MRKRTKKRLISLSVVSITAGFFTVSAYIRRLLHSAIDGVSRLPENFTVTAHTGANKTEMNTAESLAVSLNSSADIAEIDLSFTPDKTAVLSHDSPNDGCYTLKDAFLYAAANGTKRINVDVKSTKYLEQLPLIALQTGLSDRIFLTGIELKDIDEVRKKAPNIEYYLNYKPDKALISDPDYVLSLVRTVKDAGAVGLNINLKYASEQIVEIFRENGLLVSLWTANSVLEMINTLKLSPDNITTKRPDILSAIIDLLR